MIYTKIQKCRNIDKNHFKPFLSGIFLKKGGDKNP